MTYESSSTIGECLLSIPEGTHVVVVDNASTDDTVASVKRARPDATLVVNDVNRGFAAAANQGIQAAPHAADIMLLNPDAMLAAGAIESLTEFLDANERAAAVSAYIEDGEGRPERVAGGRDATITSVAVYELGLSRLLPSHSLYRSADRGRPLQFDWVAGTAVLLRRTALAEVGPFDESYFLYAEDLDWCHRARQREWQCWVTPRARAIHAGSATVNAADAWVDRWRLGSLDTYIGRTSGRATQLTTRVVRAAGAAARSAVFFALSLIGGRDRRAALRDRAMRRKRDAVALAAGRFG